MLVNVSRVVVITHYVGYIDEGLRYLGFHLKPNGYGPKYWVCFEKSINQTIGGWLARYLSLGDIFLLASLVLQGIPVIYFSKLVYIGYSLLLFQFLAYLKYMGLL